MMTFAGSVMGEEFGTDRDISSINKVSSYK